MSFESRNPATGELLGVHPEHDKKETNATAQFPDVSIRLIATGRHVDWARREVAVCLRRGVAEQGKLIGESFKFLTTWSGREALASAGTSRLDSRTRGPLHPSHLNQQHEGISELAWRCPSGPSYGPVVSYRL
jgi:hypothetical protein